MVVRQLHKHDGTKWDCLVPQWLSDNFTNTMGQSETVLYINGGQTTSQTRWDKVRLFSTSMVVRQLHKHEGTKWDFSTSRVVRQFHKHNGTNWECLVPQWLSDHKHDGTKWHCLVPHGWSDIITNTIGQSETVWYIKGCQTTSQTRWDKVRLVSTSSVVRQLHKHDGTKWDCLLPQGLSDTFTNKMGQCETV